MTAHTNYYTHNVIAVVTPDLIRSLLLVALQTTFHQIMFVNDLTAKPLFKKLRSDTVAFFDLFFLFVEYGCRSQTTTW